jgi:hypothetical protein
LPADLVTQNSTTAGTSQVPDSPSLESDKLIVPLGYNEQYANVSPTTLRPRSTCPSFFLAGSCENGHRWAKKLVCGKEWCPICGAKESDAHNRRIARILPKGQQMQSMGYFVIEFPLRYRKVRGYVYSKRGLGICSRRILDVLAGRRGTHGARDGYFKRGILRWHWFGDPVAGVATWNPHANVLVDGGYLSPGELEAIKGELRNALKCPDLIVNYSYHTTPGQMYHKLSYVTRATFLQESWDEYMSAELWNFRNIRAWGKWRGPKVWEVKEKSKMDDLIKLESGCCPDCGKPIHWNSKAWPIGLLECQEVIDEVIGGYYRLKPFPSPTAYRYAFRDAPIDKAA